MRCKLIVRMLLFSKPMRCKLLKSSVSGSCKTYPPIMLQWKQPNSGPTLKRLTIGRECATRVVDVREDAKWT